MDLELTRKLRNCFGNVNHKDIATCYFDNELTRGDNSEEKSPWDDMKNNIQEESDSKGYLPSSGWHHMVELWIFTLQHVYSMK